jgi:hypothetical protein
VARSDEMMMMIIIIVPWRFTNLSIVYIYPR